MTLQEKSELVRLLNGNEKMRRSRSLFGGIA